MINLSVERDDNVVFVSAAEAVINGVAQTHRIRDVIVVKVDNWFGAKWLGFSHKTLGTLGVHRHEDLSLPPFRPSRIESEREFTRDDETPSFSEANIAKRVHLQQPSPENLSRRMSRVFPNTALFWWSGRSASNGRGSLMCYLPGEDGHVGWYAGFRCETGWTESDSVFVTKRDLARFACGPVSVRSTQASVSSPRQDRSMAPRWSP